MNQPAIPSGRVQKAPENFLTRDGIKTVFAEGRQGRRNFIRSAFDLMTIRRLLRTVRPGHPYYQKLANQTLRT